MLQIGDDVKVKNPETKPDGERLSQESLDILKALNHTGVITRIVEDEGRDLFYVGFVHEQMGWLTQGFREDQLEKVN